MMIRRRRDVAVDTNSRYPLNANPSWTWYDVTENWTSFTWRALIILYYWSALGCLDKTLYTDSLVPTFETRPSIYIQKELLIN